MLSKQNTMCSNALHIPSMQRSWKTLTSAAVVSCVRVSQFEEHSMSRDLGRRPIELDLHGQRQNSIKTPYRMIAARLVVAMDSLCPGSRIGPASRPNSLGSALAGVP